MLGPINTIMNSPLGIIQLMTPYVIYDSFTAPDGTDLYGHFPDINLGNAWIGYLPLYSGGFLITSGAAAGRPPFVGNDRYQWIETGLSNCRIVVTFSGVISGATFPKFYVRLTLTPSNNCWILAAKPLVNDITELTGGVFTIRASVANVKVSPGVYTMEAILSGNSITLICNSGLVTFSSATHNANTKHGFSFNSAQANMNYDEFMVFP